MSGYMKIRDLKTGDIIIDGDRDAVITGLTCDGNIESTVNQYSNIENISDKPLTEEILLKNEFYCERGVGYLWEFDNDAVIVDMYDNNLRIILNREKVLDYNTFDTLSVRELQHALWFFKIDLDIKI